MEDPVLLERDGAVALLRLNRPKAYNAANYDLMRTMCEQMVALAADGAGYRQDQGLDRGVGR